MSTAEEIFRAKIQRRAITMEIGGFKPPENPQASWFGKIAWGKSGESWPTTNGQPLHALAQINLTELPFVPAALSDLAFITVFVNPDPNHFPNGDPNGTNWCLRSYRNLEELQPLQIPNTDSKIKAFPMRPKIVEADYPMQEDVADDVPEEIEGKFYDLFSNTSGFKIGGWPSLIQSEIFWAPFNKHPASPNYVFQIDSTEKGNWFWGDGGVGYFGRGTTEGHKDEWAIEWQCH